MNPARSQLQVPRLQVRGPGPALGRTPARALARLARATFLVLASVAFGVDALAQAPKAGREKYVDNVDLGFELKRPKDWDLIPPEPGEQNMIAKFSPTHNKTYQVSLDDFLSLDVYLLRFDKERPPEEGEEEAEQERTIVIGGDWAVDNAYDYVTKRLNEHAYGRAWQPADEDHPADLKLRDVAARYSVYEGMMNPNATDEDQRGHVCMYIAEYDLDDYTTVAMVGFGPGEKKWRDYEKAYEKLAKSFQRVDIIDPFEPLRTAPDAATLRGQKRLQLHMDAAKTPGWKVYETENYFVVSANEDTEFLEEVMERLEAIRAVFEEDYPADKARRSARPRTEGGTEGGVFAPETEEEEDPDAANRSVSVLDSLELSRTSVVRICRSRDEYHEYGGPPGSAGYWSSGTEELVIYDDKAYGGRSNTWLVLNHEAFHQYIFYFYGSIAPHSWYNEGTGDFYSGYQLKNGRFVLKENSWRKGRIQEMLREGEYVPLKDLVRWSKSQYYGNNDLGYDGGMLYAQGWSLVYFLRTAKGSHSDWDEAWDGILDTYLDTLGRTGELDEAVEKAFEGIDFDALEAVWKDYIG